MGCGAIFDRSRPAIALSFDRAPRLMAGASAIKISTIDLRDLTF
jgi:hypothetical protein